MAATFDSSAPFGAVLTAMVTPFHTDGSIDIDSAVKLAKHLVEQGNDGLVLNGTTGEAPTTHSPEKFELVQAVAEAVGDRAAILAGAGSNDTRHAVRMAEQAAEAGAHGILAVTPYYSRPSQAGLVAHMEAIADATDVPVMLYDIPGRSGVRIATSTYERLAGHKNITSVKDATGDVGTAAVNMAATDLVWYSGDDGLFLPFLSLGAVGVVSVVSHVATPTLVEISTAFAAGRHQDAIAAANRLLPITDAIMGTGAGVVMVKAALKELGLIPTDTLRLPQVGASEAEIAVVTSALKRFGL